jgi:glucose/arabinose dehydrogenase
MLPTTCRHAAATLVLGVTLLAGLAACDGAATPPPSVAPTATPASVQATSAPTSLAPASAGATSPPSPVASRDPIAGLSIGTAPFAKVPGAALTMAAPNDGTGRLFVGNQAGQVWVVGRDGTVQREPFVDLRARIRSGGEQGLLGLAVHPAFPVDPRVFVDFTNKDGDTVIASLTVDPANENRLDPASFKQLLFIDQPFANHNGGSLQFGRDGFLTIAMGDGGSGGDPSGNGQNQDALLAKILRIDIDGATASRAYGIPLENPFANGGGAPEVWISGLRNPWRTSFDRKTGDFWIGDVGQSQWEEIDVVRSGTTGQINFGWNVTEGFHCYDAASCDRTGIREPVTEFGHDLGCAVVGGFVYRGAADPFLDGVYLFSDNCSSRLWAYPAGANGPPVLAAQVGQVDGNVSSFGEDTAGEPYLLMLDGSVLRVTATQG